MEMSVSKIERRLAALEEALRLVARQQAQQTQRDGYLRHGAAANYLGRSREWLRRQNVAGTGPKREPDGTYKISKLDEFKNSG